jgi:hypothetical protein
MATVAKTTQKPKRAQFEKNLGMADFLEQTF